MRRTFTASLLLAAALFWSACGGSNTNVNSGRDEAETTVNSERIEGSNIAPTGGPGPEPENSGRQSSTNANKNANEGDTGDKKQPDSKNKNSQ